VSFCIAPFLKINHDLTGNYRPCDFHDEFEGEYKTPEECFRSPEMELMRLDMIHGLIRDECSNCHKLEDVGIKSRRQHFNEMYPDEILELKMNPRVRFPIKDLEMSFDNTCNFACVTCSPTYSSQWERELGIIEKTTCDLNPDLVKNLKHLTLLGGEPMLSKRAYTQEFFKTMHENFDFENALLVIYTNNSIQPKGHWYNLLKKVKNLIVFCSLDGVDEVGEYVRFGHNQEIFDYNYHIWKGFADTRIAFTTHIMNIFQVNKMLERYDEVDFQTLHSPKYLNPSILPAHIKDMILQHDDSDFIRNYLNSGDYDEDECKSYLCYVNYLRNRRGEPPEECLRVFEQLYTLFPTVETYDLQQYGSQDL